ncbi:MAG: DUF11 domain-containing protein [Thermoanaerobaculales bacterium]|nr:DUF11 domain-containing protein [Thermoanaerobaculales bacterium]
MHRDAVVLTVVFATLIFSVPAYADQPDENTTVSRGQYSQSYPAGPLVPPGPIDEETATTIFSVFEGDFPVNTEVIDVDVEIQFSKLGNGTNCPGPSGGDDWAEEIRMRLYSPDGTRVALVRYNDYDWSNPDVGPVTVIFDDDGTRTVAGTKIQSGTFLPSSGAMADFNGVDPAADGGEWTLEISDQYQSDPVCFIDATLTITTGGPFDAGVHLSDSPDPLKAGEILSYEVVVAGDEDDDISQLELTLTLPEAFIYLENSGEPGQCTYQPGGGSGGENLLSCSRDELPARGVWSLDIAGRVPVDSVAGEIDGTAIITGSAKLSFFENDIIPFDNTSTASTLVMDEADLAVTKLIQPAIEVAAGEAFTYTIFVDNMGPSSARNVVLQDDILLSGDYTIIDIADDPHREDSCALQRDSVRCTLADALEPMGFAPGGGRWTVTVELVANTAQTVSNLVTVLSEDPDGSTGPGAGTPDPNTTNNQATSFVDVTAVADLGAELTVQGEVQIDGEPGGNFAAQADAVTAGGDLSFLLTVGNAGPSAATNVETQLTLPLGVEPLSVTSSQGNCGPASMSPVCVLGAMDSASAATVTATARVAADTAAGTDLEAGATVTSAVADIDNSDNLSSASVGVDRWADLGVSILATPAPCPPGETLAITANVTNRGPSDAAGGTVTFTSSGGVTFLESTQCAADGTTVSCDVPALVVGASVTVGYVARIDDDAPAAIDHLATVIGVENDPLLDDNTQATSVITDVVPPQVLSLDSIPATRDGVLTECESTSTAPTGFSVHFDEAVLDPPGDSDLNDVTNPANYRVLSPGADLSFETYGCEALAGDDTEEFPSSVTYTAGDRIATATMAAPLAASQYRLAICGVNGIVDTVGNALDGDGDGIGGDDHLLPFRVAPGNLFANGYLDCNLDGWELAWTPPDEMTFDQLDRWGSPSSGSLVLRSWSLGASFSVEQCVPVPGLTSVAINAQLELSPDQGTELTALAHCEWFGAADCASPQLGSDSELLSVGDTGGSWTPIRSQLSSSADAQSVRCGVTLQSDDGGFEAHLDELMLEDIPAGLLFTDGFEYGDTQRWGRTVP